MKCLLVQRGDLGCHRDRRTRRHRLCYLRRRGRRRFLVEAAASTPVGRYVSDREGLLNETDGQFHTRTSPIMPAFAAAAANKYRSLINL